MPSTVEGGTVCFTLFVSLGAVWECGTWGPLGWRKVCGNVVF